MNLSIGIIGLPNVGKSTLFNALTKQNVASENYPFCTIEPNVAVVEVEDERLSMLSKIEKSKKTVYAIIRFVDIAGLVKGASKGEGLGNKFLSHIREVNCLVHVIRTFVDDKITHIDKSVDPKRDVFTINAELLLKDLDTVVNRIKNIEKKAKFDERLKKELAFLNDLKDHIEAGKLSINFERWGEEEFKYLEKELSLLTHKEIIYLLNETQEKISDKLIESFSKSTGIEKESVMALDIKLEQELSVMSDEDRESFLSELNIDKRPLSRLIMKCYKLLGLQSFFTTGEDESRAWTIKKGSTILEAAETIHTDFKKNFIAAEVVKYDEFVNFSGWTNARKAGKVQLVGREYIVQDGDILIIRHNS